MIQPCADTIHGRPERDFRLLFDAYDEGGIERHVALLPLPVRREPLRCLSVGAASLARRTNDVRYRTIGPMANPSGKPSTMETLIGRPQADPCLQDHRDCLLGGVLQYFIGPRY